MGKAGIERAIGLALALAAILAPAAGAPQSYQPQSSYAPPAYSTPSQTPPPSSYTRQPSSDQCGAGELQYLVGQPTTEIPIPLEPSRRRVVCTTCPMTQEHYSFRQTILFDATTGRVTSVSCG